MIVTTNFKERIKTMGLLALQSYKILMGTMISVFVPQKCFDKEIQPRLCTINDNLNNDDYTHRTTLIFNCVTAFSFLFLYIVEINRENWLIKHLDIDHSKPDDNLKTIVLKKKDIHIIDRLNYTEGHKKYIEYLSRTLAKKNKYYLYSSLFTSFIFTINNLASINILSDSHYGSATLNTYLSFLMLILVKLYNSISVSYRSKRDQRALSAYLIEFSSFNSLDKKNYIAFNNKSKDTIELITVNI